MQVNSEVNLIAPKMDTRSVTRRRFSAVPVIKKVPAPSHNSVTKGTKWSRRGGRVIFLDENGNEIAEESKASCQGTEQKRFKRGATTSKG